MENNRVVFEEYDGDQTKLVGYKKIIEYIIFNIKLSEGFRRKARYIADGYKISALVSITYITMVS